MKVASNVQRRITQVISRNVSCAKIQNIKKDGRIKRSFPHQFAVEVKRVMESIQAIMASLDKMDEYLSESGKNMINRLNSKNFIDLFAGCGGISLGLMQAGWRGLFAIEKEKFAFETLSVNLIEGKNGRRYEWPSWLDKRRIAIGRFMKKYHGYLVGLKGQVDLIAGGPPCQGFSLVGRREKNDPRNKLYKYYIEFVKLIQPNLLIIENVRGIDVHFEQRGKKKVGRPPRSYAERIQDALMPEYEVRWKLVKAVDFGVPQYRPRFIMLGIKRSLIENSKIKDPFRFFFEELLEGRRKEFLEGKGLPSDKPIGVEEAISDLETKGKKIIECEDSIGFYQIEYEGPLTNYQKFLHSNADGVPPNSLRLAKHKERTLKLFAEMLKTCKRGISLSDTERTRLGLKKHCLALLDPGKPSHTLTTLPDDLLHYSEPRILTVRECARLQSFPDWFEFKGKYTTGGDKRTKECPRYTQVGNAVPPLLAEAIGEALAELVSKVLPSSHPSHANNQIQGQGGR